MRILQLSDSHVRRPGDPLSGRVETLPFLEHAVSFVERLTPRPDVVIVTGDIVDLGLPEEYELARAALARLTLPVLVLPGNHDERGHCRAALGHCLGEVLGPDCLAYVDDRFPVRIVALDSVIPMRGEGRLGAPQLEWLARTLAAGAARPTVVALHHPPFDVGIGFMDRLGLEDREELLAILSRHPQVVGVLAGHVHRTIIRRLGHAVGMIAPSTAHQIPLELKEEGPEVFDFEPPGCLLHEGDGSGLRS
ncbi:MAG TPA: phosphodiesterase, partial [Gemmatimonadales bacterium]|nr:phosphodiesterase [Gemmatimonadales bacterium]